MRAKLFTLRFSPTLGRFDDAPLVSLQQKVVLEHLHEHLVTVGGESMLLCMATWRERTAALAEHPNAESPQPKASARSAVAEVADARRAAESPTVATRDDLRPWRPKATAPSASEPAAGSATTDEVFRQPRGAARSVGELRQDLDEEQRGLFDRLRRWRRHKAHEEGLPSYVILTNRQLVEIVRQRPDSRAALAQIRGLGDKKLARHGQEMLAILWPDAPTDEPSPKVDLAVEAAS